MGQRWPNCDPILRKWVTTVVARLEHELGPNLVGTYLHGSLAAGAFYSPKSDVDLLFVCARPLSITARRSFAYACVEVSRHRPIVGGLECSVILEACAGAADYPMPCEVHFSEDRVDAVLADEVDHERAHTDPDLSAHCQAVLEIGVVLHGPPIAATFGPVAYADFIEAVTGDVEWILDGANIVESPFYGVLNSCRMLWLWQGHSKRLVPTKEEAATWCLTHVPGSMQGVIKEALDAYRSAEWVRPEDRKTGGRVWNSSQLLAFRNYVRQQRPVASAS